MSFEPESPFIDLEDLEELWGEYDIKFIDDIQTMNEWLKEYRTPEGQVRQKELEQLLFSKVPKKVSLVDLGLRSTEIIDQDEPEWESPEIENKTVSSKAIDNLAIIDRKMEKVPKIVPTAPPSYEEAVWGDGSDEENPVDALCSGMENMEITQTKVKAPPSIPKKKGSKKGSKKESKKEVKKIELLPHQIQHFHKISKLFEQGHKFYIDCSLMGAGKTYIALYLAKLYKLPICVVCPKSMINTWESTSKEYGIKLLFIDTYQRFRGTKKKLNHEYLRRKEVTITTTAKTGTVKSVTTPVFRYTKLFRKLVEKGVLIILDEIQYTKNKTAQAMSCAALTQAVYDVSQKNPENKSKMAFLSATPFDKPECVENILRLTNMIRSPTLFTSEAFGRNFELTGLAELRTHCRKIDSYTTKRVFDKHYYITARNVHDICYSLYVHVVKPKYVSIMKAPEIRSEFDAKNGHYTFATPEKLVEMDKAIADLMTACRYRKDTQTIGQGPMNMGGITTAMKQIETLKLELVIRLVRQKLQAHPNNKVIAYVSYTDSLNTLQKVFREYNPLYLNGSTDTPTRKLITEAFQSHCSTHRLLIGNLRVGGIGIDLHDTQGNYSRYMYIIPTFSVLDLHQASGRIYRSGTKSKATVRFVYSQLDELKVINALARKTTVLRNIATDANSTVLFPGEYPKEIEPNTQNLT